MRRPSKAREARAAIDPPQAAEVNAAADEEGIDKDRRGGDVGRWSVGEEGARGDYSRVLAAPSRRLISPCFAADRGVFPCLSIPLTWLLRAA